MDTITLLRDLFRHMEWADALVWNAVLGAPAAAEDKVMHDRLHHVHLVQRAFLLVWRRERIDFSGAGSLSAADLARWARAYHGEVARFLETVAAAPSSLDDPVRLPWAAHVMDRLGPSLGTPTLGEAMTQVTAHSTYHRAQANLRLRELGVEPPLTDFVAWIWLKKPAAQWPRETD